MTRNKGSHALEMVDCKDGLLDDLDGSKTMESDEVESEKEEIFDIIHDETDENHELDDEDQVDEEEMISEQENTQVVSIVIDNLVPHRYTLEKLDQEQSEEEFGSIVEEDAEDEDDLGEEDIVVSLDNSGTIARYQIVQSNSSALFSQTEQLQDHDSKTPPKSSNAKKMVKLTFGSSVPVSTNNGETSDYDSEHHDGEPRSGEKYPQIVRLQTSHVGNSQRTIRFIKFDDENSDSDSGKRAKVLQSFEVDNSAEYDNESNEEVTYRRIYTKRKLEGRQNSSTSAVPKSIACPLCKFRAHDVQILENHMQTKHDSKLDLKKKSKKRARASVALVEDLGSDEEHQSVLDILDETRESKNPNFECWRCNNRRFAGSGSLRRHINAVHHRLGNHPCPHCGRLFSAKHNLKVHVQTVHMRMRNYSCNFCSRTYTENRSLKRHMDASHPYESASCLEPLDEPPRQKTGGRNMNATDELIQKSLSMKDDNMFENNQLDHPGEENSENFVLVRREGANKALVVYHDHLISASEEVVVGSSEIPIAHEQVFITNNVDLPVPSTTKETIEIKFEVNCDSDKPEIVRIHESPTHRQMDFQQDQIVIIKSDDDEMIVDDGEVVVSNTEEVTDSPVTVYLHTDIGENGNIFEIPDDNTNKRKPYQRIKCGYCGDFFCSRQLFYKHANKFHRDRVIKDWQSCQECKRYFPSVEAVKLHSSLIHSNENKRTECPMCPALFTRTCTFYRHANQAHMEMIMKVWLPCSSCELYMPDADKLRQHQVHAHPPKKPK